MNKEMNAGWIKYSGNPVLGGELGTCFDIGVLKDGDVYRMYFSWRPKKSVALVESTDGIHWGEPKIVIGPRAETGWEEEINRPVVVKKDGSYYMWYTGQVKPGAADGYSRIGFARSEDGVKWCRLNEPVLEFDELWERNAVMCPQVIWDGELEMFRMWYSGGEQYEPDAIGYATSVDGIHWDKYKANPVFMADTSCVWEQNKVTAGQVIKQGDWYLMFYIGFENVNTARIGIARSRDGITGWERFNENPILSPGKDTWDGDACYKPYVILDGNRWLLWYNGRKAASEQIGLATHEGEELRF